MLHKTMTSVLVLDEESFVSVDNRSTEESHQVLGLNYVYFQLLPHFVTICVV